MSTTITVIAIAAVAAAAGRLSATPRLRRLRYELHHDSLTGLYNRAGLCAAYDQIGPAQPITLMLADLDRFKAVNDSFGHHTGDAVLNEIAERLDRFAYYSDGIAARLSGDEYVLLLPDLNGRADDAAAAITTRIAQPFTTVIDGAAVTITVTASIGVVLADSDRPLQSELLRRADIAMYYAKRAGGNRHVHYQPGMTTAATHRGARLRERHRPGNDTAA